MAKKINRLKALQVKQLSKQGWYPDGQGLYLQVSPTLSKTWVYRYQKGKTERRHGLGSYPTVTLEVARNAAQLCRQIRNDGFDPIDYKRSIEAEKQLEEKKKVTFKECALIYIESKKSGWKNRKHESQWRNTLETYAYPIIGDLFVQNIDTDLVFEVLEPIWSTKTETASRVRQRIESIIDWAKVKKYRTGENPALWRGHLDKLLTERNKIQKVKHHPAMAYTDLPEYFQMLRKIETVAAKALAFAILTATRTSETRQARWSEIDLNNGVWIIPEERMKMEKEHRVPLTPECVSILKEIKHTHNNNYVFSGLKQNKAISDAALLKLLKQTHSTLTVHGFRSTFRDWCAEMTNYPSWLAEAALAHSIRNQTQAAYERGDKFDKRRKLMNTWSNYCAKNKKVSNVTPIHKQS